MQYVKSLKAVKEKIQILCLLLSSLFSILILVVLLLQILNNNLGYVMYEYTIGEKDLFNTSLEKVNKKEIITLLQNKLRPALRRNLTKNIPLESQNIGTLQTYLRKYIMKEKITKSWSLYESLTKKDEIFAKANNSKNRIKFYYWLNSTFIFSRQSSEAGRTGIRTAILGTLWIIAIAALSSIPFGIATAIYLEEYAKKNILTNIITANIYNLAGIPSIIYGLLGLALFVRILEPITQGRTLFSAGLTLGLMCLPMVIINSQEAIKAVPNTLRYSSYALGATKWQTIIHHILPYSLERIITGIILALSRVVGETAPLVVVGAATFISVDPSNIFASFTALPIQIYQWASRPQHIYYNTSSAAILVLLILIFAISVIPITIRNNLYKKEKI